MFENIAKFFKKLVKSESKDSPSKDTAKERLHLVLMQDRANVSADFLELMKQEIIEVIKKYIDVEEGAIDVRLTNEIGEDGTKGAPSLYANIPIKNIKNGIQSEENNLNANNTKPEEKSKKEDNKSEEKEQKQKVEEQKQSNEENKNKENKEESENDNQEQKEEKVDNTPEEDAQKENKETIKNEENKEPKKVQKSKEENELIETKEEVKKCNKDN